MNGRRHAFRAPPAGRSCLHEDRGPAPSKRPILPAARDLLPRRLLLPAGEVWGDWGGGSLGNHPAARGRAKGGCSVAAARPSTLTFQNPPFKILLKVPPFLASRRPFRRPPPPAHLLVCGPLQPASIGLHPPTLLGLRSGAESRVRAKSSTWPPAFACPPAPVLDPHRGLPALGQRDSEAEPKRDFSCPTPRRWRAAAALPP